MSMNYAFGFSLILLILVALNIYFFYTLNTVGKRGAIYSVPREPDLKPNVYKEIYEYLNYLPNQYKSRNTKFLPIQRNLIQIFNSSSSHNIKDVWQYTDDWISEESLFPVNNGTLRRILHDMRTAEISRVEIAPKGSQLKLSLILQNYRLDFIKYSKYWGGPTATLVPTANAHAWGVIWRLNQTEKDSLDRLKEVEEKKYYIKNVNVLTPYMGYFRCRTYIQKVNPLPRGDKDVIPAERWPSYSYKHIMLLGAISNELPEYYINYLRSLKHNDDEGCVRTDCLLIRYAREIPCECKVPGRIPRQPLKLDLKTKRNVRVQVKTK